MKVLLAIEPRVYREAIGETIRTLRPHVEVFVLDPDALSAGVVRLDHELVLADRSDSYAPTAARAAWVEYRPYERPPARICVGGHRLELEEVAMGDLVSIVDEAEELARTTRELGNC